jgi:alternate signal-mediated exported protein
LCALSYRAVPEDSSGANPDIGRESRAPFAVTFERIDMNKLVKGSIAGAVGIALLLGGAGTFALWSDNAAVNGGIVQTGTLDIALTGTAAWKDISPDAANTTWVVATDRLVPGDTVTLTQDVTVVATGKNLKALLAYTAGSITINSTVAPAVVVSLSATKVSGDATISAGTLANTYNILPVSGGTSVFRVVITVAYDKLIPVNQVGQTLSNAVDLTAANFTLTQVRP